MGIYLSFFYLIIETPTCFLSCFAKDLEGDSLRSAIDIHTLHRTVTLHDTFTGSVVSVTACLTVVRENHQPIILIPVHLTGSIRRVVRYQCWITVGIIGIMVVTNLRWSRRMVTVLILIRKLLPLAVSL